MISDVRIAMSDEQSFLGSREKIVRYYRFENSCAQPSDLPTERGCIGCGYAKLVRGNVLQEYFNNIGEYQFRAENNRLELAQKGVFGHFCQFSLADLGMKMFCHVCCPEFDDAEPEFNTLELVKLRKSIEEKRA